MKEMITIRLLPSEYLNMTSVKALQIIINLPVENQTIYSRKKLSTNAKAWILEQ